MRSRSARPARSSRTLNSLNTKSCARSVRSGPRKRGARSNPVLPGRNGFLFLRGRLLGGLHVFRLLNLLLETIDAAFRVHQLLTPREERVRSEEHTSELQSHSFISYAVF